MEVDDFCHGQLAMTLFPQRPQTFPELFANVPRQIPWRVRFDLMPGGASQLGYKNFLPDLSGHHSGPAPAVRIRAVVTEARQERSGSQPERHCEHMAPGQKNHET
ncbi:hypothetical protein C3433_26495 [Citrobacter freundii]|nr:hypothetical protein C3433_26495 [Citrobacter freundii]